MNPNTLLFSKTRDVKSPTRAHATDAGIDFFLPNEFTKEDVEKSNSTTKSHIVFDNYKGTILIPAGHSFLISAGIKCIVPKGWAMIFFNKSGVASKKRLDVGASVVDCGYYGEVHINMTNTSDFVVEIHPGEKIIQGIMLPIGEHVPCEVDDIMNYANPSERGEGGFGSTGVQ